MTETTKDCHAQEILEIVTNGLSQRYTKLAQLTLFPMKVHYNPESPAMIISLKYVASLNGVKVTIYTSK